MPKQCSPDLLAHLQAPLQTLTRCLRIERQDGAILGFTAHDQDLVFEGLAYRCAAGFTPSVVQSSDQGAVGTVEIEGLLTAAGCDKESIAAGCFDHARIELFEVNYRALSQGKLSLFTGFWGETRYQGNRYVTELRSLSDALQQPFGAFYSPTCRAQLGDHRCQVNVEAFTHKGEVAAVYSSTQFLGTLFTQPADYFTQGLLIWQTGKNAESFGEIQHFAPTGVFQLVEAPVHPIQSGDTFLAVAGCDKRLSTCHTRFQNTVNFRGEPFVLGIEQLLPPISSSNK